jgi:hypothetical protein
VVPGLWAGLGAVASFWDGPAAVLAAASGYLSGGSTSGNADRSNSFRTPEEAVQRVLDDYMLRSQTLKYEFGGSICHTTVSKPRPYTFSEPNMGVPGDPNERHEVAPSACPEGLVKDSAYHTHWDAARQEGPGDGDYSLVTVGKKDYVGTFCGYIYEYGIDANGHWLTPQYLYWDAAKTKIMRITTKQPPLGLCFGPPSVP